MFAIKYLLLTTAIAMFLVAAAIVVYDVWLAQRLRRAHATNPETEPPEPIRWRTSVAFAALAWLPMLVALSIAIVPSGHAGVKVSEISGTKSGTLYPGAHVVVPLIESVKVFDTRDKLFTTGTVDGVYDKGSQLLKVQAKEGLTLGLAITVRYQLDPRRLDYIETRLPHPIETELVPPIVASAWRELAPNYTVREVFSSRREEVRQKAAVIIMNKLAGDGVIVKEVMLRDIQLPPEYARGLEKLLLKEQENDQLNVQTEMQEKQVRISELEAEAQRVAAVKQAEGEAQTKVLVAKGEADAMQYTLPLKQKQIEQTRLEAEARKESTIKNAEASAQAKVIDSKAELERRRMLADAEANRIRVTAVADAERMRAEASVLKGNPLLINKIVAERLSDKIQLMMVPADGKFFFASDVFKSFGANAAQQNDVAEEPPQTAQSMR